jgi:hypothetical protein
VESLVSDDYLGIGKLAEAIERGTREFREVAKVYLEPIAREKGQFQADKIRFEREVQAAKIMMEADRLLQDAGIERRTLNLKIAIPLIENASLETEEELTAKWAGLLASSVSGNQIHVSFPAILAELTSTEVKILDALFSWSKQWEQTGTWEQTEHTMRKLRESLGISKEVFRISAENLLRLRLCWMDAAWSEDAAFDREGEIHLLLTALGKSFVAACHGPRKRTPS